MTLRDRLQGKQTQFHVELLYGLLFVAGFGYLAVRVDPRVAAFEGGLVVGYLLRVWEKMSIYERVLERAVSEEAHEQVADELDEQVSDRVDAELDEQVGDRVATAVDEQVGDRVDAELDERVEEIDERIDDAVDRRVEGDGTEA